MKIFRSAWVVPVGTPPLRDGAVAVEADEIVAVGATSEILGRYGDGASSPADITDLGEAVLLPAFVNAHTHLELSWMRREPPPRGDPMAWIRAMISRRSASPEEIAEEIRHAIGSLEACGTVLVGDVGNTTDALSPLMASGLGGAFFLELTGSRGGQPAPTFLDSVQKLELAVQDAISERSADPDRRESLSDPDRRGGSPPPDQRGRLSDPDRPSERNLTGPRSGESHRPSWGAGDSSRLSTGSAHGAHPQLATALAPHSPTIVSPELLRQIADRAGSRGDLISVHLAESRADAEFLERGTGPFRALMEELKKIPPNWTPPGRSPAQVLDEAGLLGPRTLAAHGVHLSQDDVRLLVARGTTVVLCPRSNAWLGVGKAPVALFLAGGLRVALGTDSYASNEDLDLLAELAALRRLAPEAPAEWVLRAATLGGAEALGQGSLYGSLEPGKRAAMCALRRRIPVPAAAPGEVFSPGSPGPDREVPCRRALAMTAPPSPGHTQPGYAPDNEGADVDPYAAAFAGPAMVRLTRIPAAGGPS